MTSAAGTAAKVVALGVMLAGSFFITRGSIAYFTEGDTHPFILEKEAEGAFDVIPFEDAWIFALHVHVVAAAFALPACIALLSRFVMRRLPRVHRWLGRVTGGVVLCALFPSGAFMALFAKGGLVSSAGFLLSGVIVAVAMVAGVVTARKRRFVQHRRAVLHVLAQLSVAVSSRAMLVAAGRLELDEIAAYVVSLWAPVLVSALIAELVSRSMLGTVPVTSPALQVPQRRTDEIPLDRLVAVR